MRAMNNRSDWKMAMNIRAPLVAAMLVQLIAVPTFAQDVPSSPAAPEAAAPVIGASVVQDIRVEGEERIEEDTVKSYMTVSVGDPIEPNKINDSLKALFATGLFADVKIEVEGTVLVVKVTENPIINRIAYEGNKKLTDVQLQQEIDLRPRVVYTRTRVQNAVQRIQQLYQRSGRFSATVEPKIIKLEQNRVDLVFEINEGESTGIRKVNFIGNDKISDSTLLGEIATRESRWYNFLASTDTYDPDRLNYDKELLRRYYQKQGYADFRVVSAVAELANDNKDFFVTFTVEEGEQYTFSEVKFDVALRDLKKEQVEEVIDAEAGDRFNAETIDDDIQKLTFEAGKLGYAFVEVEPKVEKNREKRTVALTYTIKEGPKIYVERIDIVGNVRTLDKVIRREFRLVEGDAFNSAKMQRSKDRLQRLNFFSKVEVTNENGTVDDRTIVKVVVEEQSTGELSFGAGYSTSDSILGEIALRERNFLGRGQEVGITLRLSGLSSEASLAFTEPYFLDRDLQAGFDIFRTSRDNTDLSGFEERRTGFSLRMAFPITEALRHQVRYTLRQDDIFNVNNGASVAIRDLQGKSTVSMVGQSIIWDHRDNVQLPNSGYILRADQDVAGLGGTVAFLRHGGKAEYYYPFAKQWVGSARANFGHITGLADEKVRLSDRFQIGGNQIRGFETAGIGPRDKITKDALGAEVYYAGTLELRFPSFLPEELGVSGRVFADAGTAYGINNVPAGVSLSDESGLRAALGFGFTWVSPFGPVNFDFAEAVVSQKEDEEEFFRFSFGTRF